MSRLANPEENVSIGRRLAGVREHRHLTQTEFAERLALSPRAYQNYERGEREIPAAVLKTLYEIFGVDPLWVLTGPSWTPPDGPPPPNLDVLEAVVVAVEKHLTRSQRKLAPAKKARLIKVLYLHFRDKAAVDEKHVGEMIQLTA